MSVFEELIDELKEENLLEETIFSLNRHHPHLSEHTGRSDLNRAGISSTIIEPGHSLLEATDLGDERTDDFPEQLADERESYRKRAMDEVSSLQMVEHVLSGIEREYMKIAPAAYDDLEVKKALHKYIQIASLSDSDEHSQAEYQLYRETEKWFSALSQRDANISVANVRRFCETSRPVLSSQALIALARFYRNSPYTEAVRGKFDFVMTRLFSREIDDEKRKLLFGRSEMLGHVKTLYANWASLSLETPGNGDSPAIVDAVAGFEEFVRESEAAETFDHLIASDFFNRIRLFKEQANELFMEPAVTAAAIECNARIGNRFVDLIKRERGALSEATIEEKYGYTYDTIISGAASKTLLLLELLRSREETETRPNEGSVASRVAPNVVEFERAPINDSIRSFRVNKWLLAVAVLALLLSGGIYIWSENAVTSSGTVEIAPAIDLSGSDLHKHLREARTSSETMYGMTQSTWDSLSDDEQKQFLAKALEFAKAKGMKQVNLINHNGRTVAFASDGRLEVHDPR